ncbi:hypothetical protein JMUB7533_26650 [Staphylococcus aureus]
MCIRDRTWTYNRSNVVMPDDGAPFRYSFSALKDRHNACLLYTSDAADEARSVDLGGRRIIKKE